MLAALVDYYLECLARERREEVSVAISRAGEVVATLTSGDEGRETPGGWDICCTTDAAARAQERAAARDAAVLWAPLVAVRQGVGGRRLEPVAGIFCTRVRGGLRPDPSDLWLGRTLAEEADEDEVAALRDRLEAAARAGPGTLRATLLEVLAEREVRLTPAAAPQELATAEPGSAAELPGFWVVEEQGRYDAGLVSELRKLRTLSPAGTALALLLEPGKAQPPSATELDQAEALLAALASPARPTLSQAEALAETARRPLTVITGPPGTGKTRTIAALVMRQLAAGGSVLIASKVNQAVDSAVELCERLLGPGAVLRTGSQDARDRLAADLRRLSALSVWPAQGEVLGREGAAPPQVPVADSSRAVRAAAGRCTRLARMLHRFGERTPSRWNWLTRRRLAAFPACWQALEAALEATWAGGLPGRRAGVARAVRARLDGLLATHRAQLAQLAESLENRRSRHRVFAQLARSGFPLAVTNLSVSTNLPLEPALFDLVIVDEATTCDPASLLPLLYRGRRAVLVGDPAQLPFIVGEGWRQVEPVPRLRNARGGELAAEFQLSAYHLAEALLGTGSGARLLLREHFRCPPAVIQYCNREFYGGELRIHSAAQPGAIRMLRVPGKQVHPRGGSRLNPAQLETALAELLRLAAAHPGETLGLVTPYRAFADAAQARARAQKEFRALHDAGTLIIGTAHRFQGSEVDHLVFATVAGSNAREWDLRWVEAPRLFNVAVTRARRSLVLVADPQLLEGGRLPRTGALARAEESQAETSACQSDAGDTARRAGQWLQGLGVAARAGGGYRGYGLHLQEDAEPPGWGARCLTWEEIAAGGVPGVVRRHAEAAQLQGLGLRLLTLTPATWEAALARWLAEQELHGTPPGAP